MSSDAAVITWLLDGDPAVRHQVLRDLADAPPEAVAAERARITAEGQGPALLAEQRPTRSPAAKSICSNADCCAPCRQAS